MKKAIDKLVFLAAAVVCMFNTSLHWFASGVLPLQIFSVIITVIMVYSVVAHYDYFFKKLHWDKPQKIENEWVRVVKLVRKPQSPMITIIAAGSGSFIDEWFSLEGAVHYCNKKKYAICNWGEYPEYADCIRYKTQYFS